MIFEMPVIKPLKRFFNFTLKRLVGCLWFLVVGCGIWVVQPQLKAIDPSILSTHPWTPPIIVSELPPIYYFEQFATPTECAAISKLGESLLRRSEVMDPAGHNQSNMARTGMSATLNSQSDWNNETRSVVRRMDAVVMLPSSHGQFIQVSQYSEGEFYDLHRDSSVKIGRAATVLLFLEEPEQGGELIFPWAVVDGSFGAGVPRQDAKSIKETRILPTLAEVCTGGMRIPVRSGDLVVFWNHDPMGRDMRPYTIHGSCPVQRGRKRIAQRWYQWFPLHGKNTLGSLIDQVGLTKQWRV